MKPDLSFLTRQTLKLNSSDGFWHRPWTPNLDKTSRILEVENAKLWGHCVRWQVGPMFWKIVVHSASRIKQGKKNSCSSQTAWLLKVKAAHSFEMSRTKHPVTQCDITGDLKPHTHKITFISALSIWHVSVTYGNGAQSYLPLHCILSMSRQCRSLCRVLPLRPPNTKTCKTPHFLFLLHYHYCIHLYITNRNMRPTFQLMPSRVTSFSQHHHNIKVTLVFSQLDHWQLSCINDYFHLTHSHEGCYV
jgi:hypothetical protein